MFDLQIFPGKYNILIEYIGFNTVKYEGKVIRKNTDFGKILMIFSENQLEEIELIGERTEVEIRLDKKIYKDDLKRVIYVYMCGIIQQYPIFLSKIKDSSICQNTAKYINISIKKSNIIDGEESY